MELAAMPARIAQLPRDKRGYPIPWNVLKADDGTPFFTVNDDTRSWRALRENLCPICGERLGRWRWLAGGPRSAFDPHGWYLDLPMHRECVEFALVACPYLSMPKFLTNAAPHIPHPEKLPPEARLLLDETVIPDRPEVFVAVVSNRIELQNRYPLLPYFRPMRPFVEWTYWRHGKQLTEDEALPWMQDALGLDWLPPRRAE